MKLRIIGILTVMLCAACGGQYDQTASPASGTADLDELARNYLFLELSMGLHDGAHVDAYFGPTEITAAAEESQLPLAEIDAQAAAMISKLQDLPADSLQHARIEGLIHRLGALRTRILLNQGQTMPFDEESRLLFGTQAPDYEAAHFDAILAQIDALLPGEDDLSARVNDFQDQFVIPKDRLTAVFEAAIAECRRRTLEHIDLPDNESFTLEYVSDKPWSGYNWYQGNAQSLIQINTDLPIFISRAVDLGCHEGYPGHHTFNALLEKNLVNDKGWVEYSLYPLFSPQSLIAEGSGNYGIDLAFPGEERIEFERRELFPLAGLDAAEADRYYQLLDLLGQLNYAGNEAARDYLNGDIDKNEAAQWLVSYSLNSEERAMQRIKFFDAYRSYVINYNLGKDMVREYIERDASDQAARWQKFEHMLSSPMLPGDLE